MTLWQGIVLGLVQGLTEFLPVSSSGHLRVLEVVTGVHTPGVFVEVMLHVATVGSVLVVYGARLWAIVRGVLARRPAELRTAGLLLLATLPAGVIGVLFHRQVEAGASLFIVGTGFLLTGFMNWSTRRLAGSRSEPTVGVAVGIGFAQALAAVFRGVSRSGSTVCAALWGGLGPAAAAEFSFLLAVPVIAGADLAARWGVPQCGLFRRLDSTLDAIHDLGAQSAPTGSVVLAEEQAAGRGRDGRTWHSPVGGVWLGMLLRPARCELGVMSVRVGLAVADVVDALLGRVEIRLKWPNDVLLADRKLAGILCEGRWHGDSLQWLAVGVGVNVCNPIPPAVARQAVALHEWLPAVRRLDVLDRLVPVLAGLASGEPALSERECTAFAARDWLQGRQLRSPAAGRARGLRPDGALLVDLGAATIAVREGHVELA